MILVRPLAVFRVNNLKVSQQLGTSDRTESWLFEIVASIGRLAPEETALLKFLRQIQKFPKLSKGSNSSHFSFLLLGSGMFHQSFGSSAGTLDLVGVAWGSP